MLDNDQLDYLKRDILKCMHNRSNYLKQSSKLLGSVGSYQSAANRDMEAKACLLYAEEVEIAFENFAKNQKGKLR